jgi:hypothetical protein
VSPLRLRRSDLPRDYYHNAEEGTYILRTNVKQVRAYVLYSKHCSSYNEPRRALLLRQRFQCRLHFGY